MGGKAKESIATASEMAKDRLVRDDWQKKYSKASKSAQHNIGQVSGDAYDSFQMGMADAGEIIRRNTESLPGAKQAYKEEEDTSTSEANYSSSGQTQTSSGKGKKANLSDKDKKKVQGASKKLTIKKK